MNLINACRSSVEPSPSKIVGKSAMVAKGREITLSLCMPALVLLEAVKERYNGIHGLSDGKKTTNEALDSADCMMPAALTGRVAALPLNPSMQLNLNLER